MQQLSIIIPTYNESQSIENTLISLMHLIEAGHEVIIVDGGSEDDTVSICKKYTGNVLLASKGRANQMNCGAQKASKDILVFLHADTILPDNAAYQIINALSLSNSKWGHFKVKLNGENRLLRIIEFLMNTRSCFTGIVTGDQTMFIRRTLFEIIHGYKNIPLMEDVEISKSLKKYSMPICMKSSVISSSRRWETKGYLRTIFLMWKLRLLYFLGVSAKKLVKLYYS